MYSLCKHPIYWLVLIGIQMIWDVNQFKKSFTIKVDFYYSIYSTHMRSFVSCLVELLSALFNLDTISSLSGRHLISKPLPRETSGKRSLKTLCLIRCSPFLLLFICMVTLHLFYFVDVVDFLLGKQLGGIRSHLICLCNTDEMQELTKTSITKWTVFMC